MDLRLYGYRSLRWTAHLSEYNMGTPDGYHGRLLPALLSSFYGRQKTPPMITIDIRELVGFVVVLAFILALGMNSFNRWRKESEKRAIWRKEQKKLPKAIRMDGYKKSS